MPKELYERLCLLRRYASRQLILCLALILFGGVLLVALIHWRVKALCVTAFLFFLTLVLFRCNEKSVSQLSGDVYRIPIEASSVAAVADALGCETLSENAFAAIRDFHGCMVRLLLQYEPLFYKEKMKKERTRLNKLINRRCSISDWGASDEVAKRLRINLVVCDEDSSALTAWVNANADHLIHRNECIFQAAIALESKTLFFPAISEAEMLHEVKRYCVAAEFLCAALAVSA